MPILYHPTLENVNVDAAEELVDRYVDAGWRKTKPNYDKARTSAETSEPVQPVGAPDAEARPAKKSTTKKSAAKKSASKK
jgi:hypothetical protein